MPEIKHQFTGGKMNKDLDERLVPNGQYRDAMNIQVATSEGSDVGTVQNILGNRKISYNEDISEHAVVVASISDEKNDTLYWFVWDAYIDYIFSYKAGDALALTVFRDVNKNVLKFDKDIIITGINIIDEMLFWTDNKTEPKKINIKRSIEGTPSSGNIHTKLINDSQGVSSINIEEKHITIIKKTPPTPLSMELVTLREPSRIYTGVIAISDDDGPGIYQDGTKNNSFHGARHNFSGITTRTGSNTFNIWIEHALDAAGNEISIGPVGNNNGLTGWHSGTGTGQAAIPAGTRIVFKPYHQVSGQNYFDPPGIPVTAWALKGIVEDAYLEGHTDDNGSLTNSSGQLYSDFSTWYKGIKVRITSIEGTPPVVDTSIPYNNELRYVIDLFDEDKLKLFEFKFPRFSYRYKYEDGEYSPFAPFTQVAFSPGSFDYHPKKGYNLGMINRLSRVELGNFIHDKTPKDVVSVDILFKDEPSPNIYVVDTIKPDANPTLWLAIKNGGTYTISKETISSIVPSNQLLRPWDNVPRKALAQDITGNRIVYGNYVQNYDLIADTNKKYEADFSVEWKEFPPEVTDVGKSIKSLREYQLGVVFTDKYGRETPVISNQTGTKKLTKDYADKHNRIEVEMLGNEFPQGLTHFKFFVKETSEEYYNMAMDRWYDAEDGNIWLAFPSSDRNKIDIDTFLILKKGTDQNTLVSKAARYKVIAIKNEAPDFIKTTKNLVVKSPQHKNTTSTPKGDNDFFPTLTTDPNTHPFVGENEFKLRYQPFYGTTGQNLDSNKEDLYIEFASTSTSEVSKRYKITSITNDYETKAGADDAAGVDPSVETALYSIKLKDPLGSDVGFVADNNTTQILNNTIVNIYEYKVENRPQFDGRFFVKIYEDDIFKTNIATVNESGNYVLTTQKKVYGLNSDHVERHSKNTGRFLVNNVFPGADPLVNPGGYPVSWDSSAGGSTWSPSFDALDSNDAFDFYWLTASEQAWGYYLDDRFSAFALYFRRYAKSNVKGGNYMRYEPENNPGSTILNEGYHYHHLYHLKYGIGDGTIVYDADSGGSGEGSQGKKTKWKINPGWVKEFGCLDTDGGGPTNNGDPFSHTELHDLPHGTTASFFLPIGDPNAIPTYGDRWRGYVEGFKEIAGNDYEKFKSEQFSVGGDMPRDTEVWFIDNGPRIGHVSSSGDLDWPAKQQQIKIHNPSWSGWSNTGNVIAGGNPNTGTGITYNSTKEFNMEIGFGGIMRSKFDESTENFFNIGDWKTQNNQAVNEFYNAAADVKWAENFDIGKRFYWVEDPNQTRYQIGGGVTDKNKKHARHSNKTASVETKNGSQYGPQRWRLTSSGKGIGGHFYNTSASPTTDFATSSNLNDKNMAEGLSFNLTKNWVLQDCKRVDGGVIDWDPTEYGIIANGTTMVLEAKEVNGSTCIGSTKDVDLIIYVDTLEDDTDLLDIKTLHIGMALTQYFNKGGDGDDTLMASTHLNVNANQWLVIRHIEERSDGLYELWLGGYGAPMVSSHHNLASVNDRMPLAGQNYTFQQVGMNGYSPNSEFNINTMGHSHGNTTGKVGAVGYTLQFEELSQEEEALISPNPAIFETEPKDARELDIYHEATGAIPMTIDDTNIQDAIPIGSTIGAGLVGGTIVEQYWIGSSTNGLIGLNDTWQKNTRAIDPTSNYTFRVVRPDGLEFDIEVWEDIPKGNSIEINPVLYNQIFLLGWHNCFSFGNGVESDRIRDNFNLAYIANGVKASSTLEQEYKEERRKYGLIYSGLYNSTSGVNNLNQFIAAEKITKDVNPIYGSIQKLHSRDSDLVTLCEDKCLKILANKDAVYNADGNTNLTATENVLGQTIPFSGEYGISTNPESFASEAYRVYFTDRVRGTVMRLSKDGLTPISEFGMKDWFRDNLKLVGKKLKIIGSYDDRNDEYVVKLEEAGPVTPPPPPR